MTEAEKKMQIKNMQTSKGRAFGCEHYHLSFYNAYMTVLLLIRR